MASACRSVVEYTALYSVTTENRGNPSMKKFISAIIMTALVGLGLVAFTSTPAQAACPYTACINTTTTVKAPAQKRAPKSVPIKVSVAAPGNAVPQGTVRVVVTKASNGRVKFDSTLPYAGGQVQFITQSLRKGTYGVTATFNANPQSVFNSSSASTSFVVKPRRKR